MLEDEVKDFLNRNACERYNGEDNLATIINKWHEPFGVEFAKKLNYPSIELVRKYKDEFEKYGVYVDRQNLNITNTNVVLFNCVAELDYSQPTQTYSVILYSDNVVTIKAKDYAFVVINELTNKNTVLIEDDITAIVSRSN